MKIEYERTAAKSYMVIRQAGYPHAAYEWKMQEHNRIPGLLPVGRMMEDGEPAYWYEITGLVSFDTVMEREALSFSRVRDLIHSVCELKLSLEKYLLDEEDICFETKAVFTEPAGSRFLFCLLPGYHAQKQGGISGLFEEILAHLDHMDMPAVQAAYAVYDRSLAGSIRTEELIRCLKESEPEKISEKHPLPADPDGFGLNSREQDQKAREEGFEEGNLWQNPPKTPSYAAKRRGKTEIGRKRETPLKLSWDYDERSVFRDSVQTVQSFGGMPEKDDRGKLFQRRYSSGKQEEKDLPEEKRERTKYRNGIRTEKRHLNGLRPEKKPLNKMSRKERKRKKKRDSDYDGFSTSFPAYEGEADFVLPPSRGYFEPDHREEATMVLGERTIPGGLKLVYRGNGEEPDLTVNTFPYLIGKESAGANGCLHSNAVSRVHAKIEKSEDTYYLEDMNSTNGTFLNGEMLAYHTPAEIRRNDRIVFASEEYRVL